ncbi:hypothetical protein DBP19_17615 [Streptomyces sp. CS090A]|nr:hypothetical protein DBP19_17615 [Streptomyces sp. CS090A]
MAHPALGPRLSGLGSWASGPETWGSSLGDGQFTLSGVRGRGLGPKLGTRDPGVGTRAPGFERFL